MAVIRRMVPAARAAANRYCHSRLHAVVVALAASNRQPEAVEIDVRHTDRTRLADAQPAAIHEHGEQPDRRRDRVDDQDDFTAAQDRRKPSRGARPHRAEGTRVDLERLLVEKHDRVRRLVLRGGRDLPLDGEMRQKRLDLHRAHRTRMPPSVASSVKAKEVHDPHPIRHLARRYRPIGMTLTAMTHSPQGRPKRVLRKHRTVTPRALRKEKNRRLRAVLHPKVARKASRWDRREIHSCKVSRLRGTAESSVGPHRRSTARCQPFSQPTSTARSTAAKS